MVLHSYFVGGICIDVFLLDSEAEECTQTFQNPVDVRCCQLFVQQILNILLDVYRSDFFNLGYLIMLFRVD